MTRALGKTHGMYAASPIDYLNPNLPAGPQDCRIEIVQWPAQGSRPVDADTGAVHARVSVDFAREFGCLLEAPIPE
jgi:hypothetical protein